MIKELVIFTTGLLTGATAAYLYLNKKYDAMLDDEIEATREYLGMKTTASHPNSKEALNEAISDLVEGDRDHDIYDRDKIIEKLNYGAMFKDNGGQKDDDEEDEEQEEIVMNQSVTKGSHAEIIASDLYYSDDEFDKKTITYYSESNVFISSTGTPISFEAMMEHIENPDFLHEFGHDEDDVLFVRNPNESTDYEIILEEREYDGQD